MDLYAENILDHYRHPRNAGVLAEPSMTWTETNVSCGDSLTLHLAIVDGRITDVKWQGSGCAISQAGMSLLSENLVGLSVTDAAALTPQSVRDFLGVPVGTRRIKCAFLCLHALKNALRAHGALEPQSWEETLKE
jgi:nitrogen fixation NifU-like protein